MDIQAQQMKREKSGFRVSGGVVMVIAGCFNLVYGIIGLLAIDANVGRGDYYPSIGLAVSGIVAFSFCCLSGFATLKERSFSMSLTSSILSFVAEFGYLVAYSLLSPHGGFVFGLVIVVPVMVFTLFGLALIMSAKSTFA